MDTPRLKRLAQTARKQLLAAIADKLKTVLASDSLARRESPRAVAELEKRIREKGEDSLLDFVAYTWFNRFCALRYMDVMGYNPVRVVSPLPGHVQPEILEEAKSDSFGDEIPLSTQKTIREICSAGRPNAQPEVYKLLLVAVCNACHRSMPFLFQPIADYTELLMPDDLLSGSSILSLIREAILPEVAESGVEVIGWLYQFYISEKKAAVMGRVVATADIPAATQLFTPDWIVRYLVENSLGRLWMLNHPSSKLADAMEYYIPATESDGDFLKVTSPEELKVCDPCCGSGHILTYAFDLLARIYEEAGVPPHEIPALILKNNLYGMEIDPRAGELAAFALTMKAREYDRRFLRRENVPRPNICVLQNVTFDEEDFHSYLDFIGRDLFTAPLQTTLRQFEQADCFGSLIVPRLPDPGAMLAELENRDASGQIFLADFQKKVLTALRQAEFLSPRYHVVVTNPPYMGGKGMNADLKKFAEAEYPDSKSDLFAMFIERGFGMIKAKGYSAMVTMQSWMFLSSYEKLRAKLLNTYSIECLAHMANMVMGIAFGTSATVWKKQYVPDHKGAFCFVEYEDLENGKPKTFPPDNERNRAAWRRNQ